MVQQRVPEVMRSRSARQRCTVPWAIAELVNVQREHDGYRTRRQLSGCGPFAGSSRRRAAVHYTNLFFAGELRVSQLNGHRMLVVDERMLE